MDQKTFDTRANGTGRNRGRTRKFDETDYFVWLEAVATAVERAANSQPFYFRYDAGDVVKSYKYRYSTARCWVYARANGTVCAGVDRPQCWPGNSVPCPYAGGARAYFADFRAAKQEVVNA